MGKAKTQTPIDHKEVAMILFENELRIDRITWLAGGTLGFTDDDFLEDKIFDAVSGQPFVHESMNIFQDLPEWAQDEDGFCEWLADKCIHGFVVEVHTPKPVHFHKDGGFTSYSFGYTAGTNIYVTDIADVVELAISWRNAKLIAWRKEAVSE